MRHGRTKLGQNETSMQSTQLGVMSAIAVSTISLFSLGMDQQARDRTRKQETLEPNPVIQVKTENTGLLGRGGGGW